MQPLRVIAALVPTRFRSRFGRDDAAGVVFALMVEALLLVALLTLGAHVAEEEKPKGDNLTVVEFQATEEKKAEETPKQAEETPEPSERQSAQAPVPTEEEPRPPTPTPKPAAVKVQDMPAAELAAADLSKFKSQPQAAAPPPGRAMVGPVDSGTAGDTPRVSGSGPNGEPLYAASWLHGQPTYEQLRDYLSTATPGWALIACRTAPNYRVQNCVKVDEWPDGSNMARAVLAAAWQFQVRPPRVGGRSMVGEWVRIRIDYNITKRP